jgi:phospholipid/cholesterol/gamma-HCH transport system ATP-binding protein
VIDLRHVDFSYGEHPVLHDVSFKVDDSESVVVMGPSGSGKSTILRLILGLDCPDNGVILVDGNNICAMKESQKRKMRKNIGMVFQDGALFDSLTVGENVGYYLLEHTKLSNQEVETRVREMLGYVNLDADDIIDKLPETLSGGMRRRVAIGRALLSTDPKVMLYDEPTTGLDPQSTDNVLGLIMKLRDKRSISTVVVTHQIADAIAIADHFVVIIAGRVRFDGSLNELRDSNDPDVLMFLAPFRLSFDNVSRRQFIAARE